jgi:hypothetical protein
MAIIYLRLSPPGFEKADFKINIDNDLLTIWGEKKNAEQKIMATRIMKNTFAKSLIIVLLRDLSHLTKRSMQQRLKLITSMVY